MLTRILIKFDDSPSWEAYTDGATWNGWIVPWVSAETKEAIAAWVSGSEPEPNETPAEIRALACERAATVDGPRDLYRIDLGLTFWGAEIECDACGESRPVQQVSPGTFACSKRCAHTLGVDFAPGACTECGDDSAEGDTLCADCRAAETRYENEREG